MSWFPGSGENLGCPIILRPTVSFYAAKEIFASFTSSGQSPAQMIKMALSSCNIACFGIAME